MINQKKYAMLGVILTVMLVLAYTSLSEETNSIVNNTSENQTSNSDNTTATDFDDDGFTTEQDCDDSNPMIFPGAIEICNAIDDSCDNIIDEGFDSDQDGFFMENCTGYEQLDCDDSNPLINPDATEVMGNNIDDDCNGSTLDSIAFSAETNQADYYLAETGTFTINAPVGTNAYITITTPSPDHNTILSFSGPYPITQPIPYLRRAGDYSIDAVFEYMNITDTTTITFTVLNTISAAISAPSTLEKNEPYTISTTASGGLGSLAYLWNFGDGTTGTGSTATHTYQDSGIYIIELSVTDSEGNQLNTSKQVEVKDKYKVTVVVRDEDTDEVIKNARVELYENIRNTGSDGQAIFNSIPEGEHTLKVTKSGYRTSESTLDVTENLTKTVLLEPKDNSVPAITLVGPRDSATIESERVTLQFRAYDNDRMECVLYLSFDNSWWTKEAVIEDVPNDVTKSVELRDLPSGPYYWKVRCEDGGDNADFSDTWLFVIKTQDSAQQPVQSGGDQPQAQEDLPPIPLTQEEQEKLMVGQEENQDLIDQIDSVLEKLDRLPLQEKEAVRLMQLEEQLLEQKRRLQQLNRDLFNIRFRRVNETERARLVEETEQDIESHKRSLVSNVEVLDSSDFVKYLSKEDLDEITTSLFEAKNISVKESQLNRMAEEIMKAQSLATISTKLVVVRLEYFYRDTTIMTVIQKNVQMENHSLIGSFVEVIPKELANSASELTVRGSYRILEEDPILEFESNETLTIYYTVDKHLTESQIEKALTIVMPTEFRAERPESAAGFAVADLVGGVVNKTIALFMLVVVIATSIVLVYFWDSVRVYVPKLADPDIKTVRSIAQKIESTLQENDVENAKMLYQDVQNTYKEMNTQVKAKVKTRLLELYNHIQLADLRKQMFLIQGCIKEGDWEKAHQLYKKLEQVYHTLPKQQKAHMLHKCLAIHKSLNEKR